MKDSLMKYKAIGSLGVSICGKLIYSMLIDNADDNGELTIPIRVVARNLSISKSAVEKNLRCLEKTDYIQIIPQYNSDGGRASNKYIIR